MNQYLPEILAGFGVAVIIGATWLVSPIIAGYVAGVILVAAGWLVAEARKSAE